MNNTISLQGELQQRQRAESKHQNSKQMTNPRLQQMKTTYKVLSTANIPTTNILVKSNRSVKHAILGKKGHREISMVDDHKYRSDEVGKTDKRCETFRFNMKMSMNMMKRHEQTNNPSRSVITETTCREQEAGYQTDDKTNIATDRSHLQSSIHC